MRGFSFYSCVQDNILFRLRSWYGGSPKSGTVNIYIIYSIFYMNLYAMRLRIGAFRIRTVYGAARAPPFIVTVRRKPPAIGRLDWKAMRNGHAMCDHFFNAEGLRPYPIIVTRNPILPSEVSAQALSTSKVNMQFRFLVKAETAASHARGCRRTSCDVL